MLPQLAQARRSVAPLGPAARALRRGYARPAARSLDRSARRGGNDRPGGSSSGSAGSSAEAAVPASEPEPEPEPEEEPWFLKEGGLRFSCKPGCGRCCTGPPGAVYFSEAEGTALAAQLTLTIREFYLTRE